MKNNNACLLRLDAFRAMQVKQLIADSVHDVIRAAFPDKYFGLCQAYAVIGSSVASIIWHEEYRPVAGLAIFDAGNGQFVRCIDNNAFANTAGGGYHCWIVSFNSAEATELLDFSLRNNKSYASAHGIRWNGSNADFLWGLQREINIGGAMDELPAQFAQNKVWFCETMEGQDWLQNHIFSHHNLYAKLTSLALRLIRTDPLAEYIPVYLVSGSRVCTDALPTVPVRLMEAQSTSNEIGV